VQRPAEFTETSLPKSSSGKILKGIPRERDAREDELGVAAEPKVERRAGSDLVCEDLFGDACEALTNVYPMQGERRRKQRATLWLNRQTDEGDSTPGLKQSSGDHNERDNR
jgi:hypothetical protein